MITRTDFIKWDILRLEGEVEGIEKSTDQKIKSVKKRIEKLKAQSER